MDNDTFLHPERSPVVQAFGSLSPVRLGLSEQVRHQSVAALNRLLAHTIAIRDLYKKSHWQTSGATFYELHLLFDKHYGEQERLMDDLAERVQTLGGVARALAHDIVGETRLARAPSDAGRGLAASGMSHPETARVPTCAVRAAQERIQDRVLRPRIGPWRASCGQ